MGAREFLQQGDVMRLHGCTIRADSGCAWLTQEDDYRDYVLAAGDAMAVERDRAPVVTALHEAMLEIHRDDPAALRERVQAVAKEQRDAAMRDFFARLAAWITRREIRA